MDIEQRARRVKLNAVSDMTQRLYEYRELTVQEYVANFRRGRLREVLPAEALSLTVEQALRQRQIGNINVRKLLISQRETFRK